MPNTRAQSLHDRATRGEQLTADERAALEAWYHLQDQAEHAQRRPAGLPEQTAQLREQVATAAARLEVSSQQIRAALAENERARREIRQLYYQLAQRTDPIV